MSLPWRLACPLLLIAQGPSTSPAPQPAGGPPLPWATVSIHVSQPDQQGGSYSNDQPNGINEHGMSLREIISEGYNMSVMPLREDQLLGLPDWARSTRYDIVGRVDPDDMPAFKKLSNLSMKDTITAFSTRQSTGEMLMVQNLLADRFHLRVHWETRERPLYTMNLARGGLRMKPAADTEHGDMNFTRGHLSGKGVPLSFLASLLEIPAERTVVDKTGVPGAYDFDLHFAPQDAPSTAENSDPDFFTAVQEQLGIKLQNTRGVVPVLVVDHIEPPTPN